MAHPAPRPSFPSPGAGSPRRPRPAAAPEGPAAAAMGPARCLALALLAWLAAPPEARLVREDEPGFGECDALFYAGTAPAGLEAAAPARLCLRPAAGGAPRLAVLYSARLRAPAFCAARAPRPAPPAAPARWLLEPQIDDPDSDLDEAVEEAVAAAAVAQLGGRQALAADYLDSEYERGPLCPFSLSDDPGEAAFALPAAAPMAPAVRARWLAAVHGLLARALGPQCGGGADLFVLAGAVPSGRALGGRVAVPELLWLAACCAAPGAGWALGFVQRARPEALLEDLMLRELQELLPARPRLFRDHCAEGGHDTERMRRVLRTVSELQAEQRAAQAPQAPPPGPEGAPEGQGEGEGDEGPAGGGLARLLRWLAAPLLALLRLLGALAAGLARGALRLLWGLGRQAALGLEGGLWRLGAAAAAYVAAIGEELLGIPWKLLKVLLRLLRVLLRALCCLLKAACRLLGLPCRVLLDVAAFPVRTVGAVPLVCRDIAAGLAGALSLLLDTAFGTVGGLLQVVVSVGQRLGPRLALDGSGEL